MEIDTSRLFRSSLFSENVNNRGNLLRYYQQLSTQCIQQQKTTSKLDEKNKILFYLSNMWNFRIWAPFRLLFENKMTKQCLLPINNSSRWILCKNSIRIGWKFKKFKYFNLLPFFDPLYVKNNNCYIIRYVFFWKGFS